MSNNFRTNLKYNTYQSTCVFLIKYKTEFQNLNKNFKIKDKFNHLYKQMQIILLINSQAINNTSDFFYL
jgi:hypothetical protein